MRILIIVTAVTCLANGILAEDTLGLWREVDGEYFNYITPEEVLSPFSLHITLHDASVFSVGGYEVGMEMPDPILILDATGPSGWTNFGDATNQLVGFQVPLVVQAEVTVLGRLDCIGLDYPVDQNAVVFHAAEPPSIPGHDGPVIADGVDPDLLIPCGFVSDSPEVFFFVIVDAVESRTLDSVRALFD